MGQRQTRSLQRKGGERSNLTDVAKDAGIAVHHGPSWEMGPWYEARDIESSKLSHAEAMQDERDRYAYYAKPSRKKI